MEHPSRFFFNRMLEYSPLWYLTLFSEHASQSFLPSHERTCRQQNAVTYFDRHFTPFSRFEITNYFGGNGPGEYFSSKRKFFFRSISRRIIPENWIKVMTRDIVSSGRSKWIDGRLVEYVQKKRWNSEDGGTRGWVIYNYSIYPNATHIHRIRMETRSVRVVAPVVPFAARRDATVKWKRSTTYALHYYFDCCFRHGSCAPLSSWIPSARLFEIEQPCRGYCQNSSSPVKTSVFPSKQRTPSSTSPFRFFRKLFHFFFSFFLFFHRSIPLVL